METKEEIVTDENHKCNCRSKNKDFTSSHDKTKKRDKYNDEINKLRKELEDKDKQISELNDKLKYQQAEVINYRKRKEEEVTNRLKYANQDLISELIIVLDNFERAIKLDDNNLNDELSKFLQGFKMMYANLNDIMKKYGLEEIKAEHQKYDPNIMEALMTDTDDAFEDEEVIEVLLKGYRLKDRVIRPASVRVNKLENKNNNSDEKEGENTNE